MRQIFSDLAFILSEKHARFQVVLAPGRGENPFLRIWNKQVGIGK